MNKRNRIKEVFTRYGYLNMEAAQPDDEDLHADMKKSFIKMTKIDSEIIRLQGCYTDIKELIKLHWDPFDDLQMEEYLSLFELI